MDIPYSLQTLPPEAVDILRYYTRLNADSAHSDSIVEGAGLTDRGFGKGIRRLVTKNYVVMSSDQVYRLTDPGRRVIEELKAFEGDAPQKPAKTEARFVRRHLVLVVPRALPAGESVEIALGFEEAADEEYLNAPANMLIRLAVLNGEPKRPREASFMLTNRQMQQSFEITAGRFTQARVRVEICQYRDDGDDFDFCGGLYVDLPVTLDSMIPPPTAYGVDVILKEEQ
jgi:predicted transcriptional regulator